jgi:pentatricopeptide repeat protein
MSGHSSLCVLTRSTHAIDPAMIATADARRRAGHPQYRETVGTAVELARRLGDAERLALAALGSAKPGSWMANANVVDEALVALYEEADAALGTSDSLLRAQALAAYEIGTAGGQPEAGNVFGGQLVIIRGHQGRSDEIIDSVRALAEAMPHIHGWTAGFVYECCETDRMEEAREAFAAMRERGLEVPVDWQWSGTMYLLASVCDYLQDTEAAAVVYPRVVPVADQVGTLVIFVQCYASLHFPAGLLASCLRRWDEAERHFARALATNERLEARPWVVRTRRGWASMLLDRNAPGDREQAAALIAAGRAEAEQLGMARELERFERLQQRL